MATVFHFADHTESAGTIITEVIPGRAGLIPRLTNLFYRAAATAHTITVMRTVAATTAGSRALSGQAVLEFTDTGAMQDTSGDDEVVAGNDFCIYTDEDGVQRVAEVSSASGNNVTMTANLAANVDAGSPIYILGEVGRSVHAQFSTDTGTNTEYVNLSVQGGIPKQIDLYNNRGGAGEPMLIHVNNVTNAGTLRHASGFYVLPGDWTST